MRSFESSVSAISNASDRCYSHSGEWKGMMTSSNGNIFRVSGLLWRGNQFKPPVTGGFPSQRPVTRSFDVFLNNQLSKQSRRWWFKTPSRSFWRHCSGGQFCWFRFNMIDYTFHTRMLLLLRCVKSVESDERPTDSFLSGSKTKGTALILRSRALSLVAWVAI